jgi:hypothetical protein
MWEDLPEQYVPRRPRLATFSESGDMAAYTSGRLIEEWVEPHILGPGCRMDDPLIKRKFSLSPRRGARKCCAESSGAKGRHRNAEAKDSL